MEFCWICWWLDPGRCLASLVPRGRAPHRWPGASRQGGGAMPPAVPWLRAVVLGKHGGEALRGREGPAADRHRSVAPRHRAGEAWGDKLAGEEGAALPTGPPAPRVGLCGRNRVKTAPGSAGRAEKTALRPTSRPKPGTATVSASSPSPELQETKAPLSTAQRPPPLLSSGPAPAATDGPVLPRAVRAAAEPRARQVLPPRRRRRGWRLHQPAPQLAERGVEGEHLPRRQRPVPAPPQRRLRPLPRRHGHAGAGLVPRLPRRAARLRPASGAGDHVAGHQGGAGAWRPAPKRQRTLPPRQRQVPPLEHRRHRREQRYRAHRPHRPPASHSRPDSGPPP